jgi:hypothetical protein
VAATTPVARTARGDVIRILTAGSDLIVVTQHEITSLDRATGEKNWITDMSVTGEAAGTANVLSGAGSTASDDLQLAVSMGYDPGPTGEGRDTIYSPICGLVALIDLETGEFGASMQVAYEGGGSPDPGFDKGMPIEIVGDTVVTAWYATIFGLDLADLSITWQHMLGSARGWEDFDCTVDDLARGDGDNVVVLNGCISDVGAGDDSLVTLDDSWNVLGVVQDERTSAESPTGLVITGIGYLDGLIGAWREPARWQRGPRWCRSPRPAPMPPTRWSPSTTARPATRTPGWRTRSADRLIG